MGKSLTSSELYCLNCGNKYELFRKSCKQKKSFHRKKLYCIHCKKTLNFIECRNLDDVEEFKERFANGEYKEEALESMETCEAEGGLI